MVAVAACVGPVEVVEVAVGGVEVPQVQPGAAEAHQGGSEAVQALAKAWPRNCRCTQLLQEDIAVGLDGAFGSSRPHQGGSAPGQA